MTPIATAKDVLERDFLEVRHRLLDIAAALDRIDRASDRAAADADHRLDGIDKALRALSDGRADRAERIQMIFSQPYVEGWRD